VNSFMFKAYNDKVVQLLESGIIEWFLRMFKPRKPIVDDYRVALSLDHLTIWFKLWIGLLLVATSVFLAELFIWKFKQVFKKKENVAKLKNPNRFF
jgi:hypothetical protein